MFQSNKKNLYLFVLIPVQKFLISMGLLHLAFPQFIEDEDNEGKDEGQSEASSAEGVAFHVFKRDALRLVASLAVIGILSYNVVIQLFNFQIGIKLGDTNLRWNERSERFLWGYNMFGIIQIAILVLGGRHFGDTSYLIEQIETTMISLALEVLEYQFLWIALKTVEEYGNLVNEAQDHHPLFAQPNRLFQRPRGRQAD